MENRKDIYAKNMTLLDALFFSYLTGHSFTSKRWSEQSQNELQLYVRNKKIFLQSGSNPAKPITTLSAQKLNDTYTVYEGEYEQYHNVIKEDIKKLEELKLQIEPLYSQFQEYEKLKKKINCSDYVDEDGF